MNPASVQIISRNGEPEYAVLPWDEYQALLRAAEGRNTVPAPQPLVPVSRPAESSVNPSVEPLDRVELVRLRKAAGLSQSQLARKSRLGMVLLLQIESGQRQPTRSMRQALAAALDVESL